MKIRRGITQIKSLDNLDYHCLKGLSDNGKSWATIQIKKFKDFGFAVPYGIIRREAEKIK